MEMSCEFMEIFTFEIKKIQEGFVCLQGAMLHIFVIFNTVYSFILIQIVK